MANFMIRFLLCNVFISGIVGILLIAKWVFRNNLSSRMQYNLWLLLLGLLAVPFIPFRLISFPQIFSWLSSVRNSSAFHADVGANNVMDTGLSGTTNWMNDFALSVNKDTLSVTGYILLGIWIVGMLAMMILVIKSSLRLRIIKRSALPLQNPEVRRLYNKCLNEMKITRNIPVYSTAFLKSPIIVGFLKPCIYLPIHLISDYHESDMRYMLLHELQHYRHKDAIANYLMNFAGVLYWFNPFVWFALREMRNDREVACDTSVLKMLEEDDYENYGNTLINFIEKVSISPFPFAAGLGGNIKQIKRRIISIASYKNPSFHKKAIGIIAFMLITAGIISFTPFISSYAAINDQYNWNYSSENITQTDLSSYFKNYEGSFVLFNSNRDSWTVYDMEHANHRISPDSTYKIYDALWGLEENIITPQNSLLIWDGKDYPFEAWNTDLTLDSAMAASANWYFQTIDERLSLTRIQNYLNKIEYGNKNIMGGLSSYWLESTLKISPVEQVELLKKLQTNNLEFHSNNLQAVKNSILLSSVNDKKLYGKTGTGRIDDKDVNGWFVGYIETTNNTCFFATNISANSDATGNSAAQITMSILSDMNIWRQ